MHKYSHLSNKRGDSLIDLKSLKLNTDHKNRFPSQKGHFTLYRPFESTKTCPTLTIEDNIHNQVSKTFSTAIFEQRRPFNSKQRSGKYLTSNMIFNWI